jgi:hypothetical protein
VARKGEVKTKTDGAILPVTPPDLLTGPGERAAWVRIRGDLARSGFSQRCDLEQVVLLCRRLARAERLTLEVSQLPSLMLGERLNPLVGELRALESGIQSSLGSLCLLPRARSSSRAKSVEVALDLTPTKEQARCMKHWG